MSVLSSDTAGALGAGLSVVGTELSKQQALENQLKLQGNLQRERLDFQRERLRIQDQQRKDAFEARERQGRQSLLFSERQSLQKQLDLLPPGDPRRSGVERRMNQILNTLGLPFPTVDLNGKPKAGSLQDAVIRLGIARKNTGEDEIFTGGEGFLGTGLFSEGGLTKQMIENLFDAELAFAKQPSKENRDKLLNLEDNIIKSIEKSKGVGGLSSSFFEQFSPFIGKLGPDSSLDRVIKAAQRKNQVFKGVAPDDDKDPDIPKDGKDLKRIKDRTLGVTSAEGLTFKDIFDPESERSLSQSFAETAGGALQGTGQFLGKTAVQAGQVAEQGAAVAGKELEALSKALLGEETTKTLEQAAGGLGADILFFGQNIPRMTGEALDKAIGDIGEGISERFTDIFGQDEATKATDTRIEQEAQRVEESKQRQFTESIREFTEDIKRARKEDAKIKEEEDNLKSLREAHDRFLREQKSKKDFEAQQRFENERTRRIQEAQNRRR